jgi:hypothetical protein
MLKKGVARLEPLGSESNPTDRAGITKTSSLALVPSLETAWQDVDSSFERFCLTAGIGAIEQMLCDDAQQLAGAPHSRDGSRVGHRWGRTKGKIGFHGANATVHRPRVRGAAMTLLALHLSRESQICGVTVPSVHTARRPTTVLPPPIESLRTCQVPAASI